MIVAISQHYNGLNFEPTLLPEAPTLGHTVAKPKGSVLQNIFSVAFATPNDKRGFVMPRFLAMHSRVHCYAVSGEMGLSARKSARLLTCFEHLAHLMRFKTQTVVSSNPVGKLHMTAIARAHTSAPTPAVGKPGTIPTSHLQSVLAAFNAANMASSYIERGNFTAARRKLTQALASINQLNTQEV